MPYLPERDRFEMDEGAPARTPGELNYALTSVCLDYLPIPELATYADYNAIIGALESAKLEFYRRAVATYEDRKRAENGDVY